MAAKLVLHLLILDELLLGSSESQMHIAGSPAMAAAMASRYHIGMGKVAKGTVWGSNGVGIGLNQGMVWGRRILVKVMHVRYYPPFLA